jgi:XRE family transcriptional regulator, regulator of sulfur utilization
MRVSPAKRHRLARAFGAVLKAARKQRGLSQEDLSHSADLDRTMPSLYERGIRTPTLTALFEIAQALEVNPTQLVADTMARMQEKSI